MHPHLAPSTLRRAGMFSNFLWCVHSTRENDCNLFAIAPLDELGISGDCLVDDFGKAATGKRRLPRTHRTGPLYARLGTMPEQEGFSQLTCAAQLYKRSLKP